MIPLYRAKKKDGEEYIEGYLRNKDQISYRESYPMGLRTIIAHVDPSTLAINMDGMIDKNEKKIFASLDQRSMIGGDKFVLDGKEYIYRFGLNGLETIVDNDWIDRPMAFKFRLVEVSGIHEGYKNDTDI